MTAKAATTPPAPPKRLGRPPVAPEARLKQRSLRMDDSRWAKLQQLGREWLERSIDRAKLPG